MTGPLLGSAIVGSAARQASKPVPAQLLPARLVRPVRMVRLKDGKLVVVKGGTRKLVIGKIALPRQAKIVPAIPKRALRRIEAQFAKSLPASMSKAQRAAAIKAFDQHFATGMPPAAIKAFKQHMLALKGDNGGGFVKSGALPAGGFGFPFGWTGYGPLTGGPHAGAPHVIGTGWLSVLATPPSPAVAAAVQQAIHGGPAGQPSGTASYGSSTSPSSATAYSSKLAVNPPVGPDLAVLQALLKATVPVHGSWGSGRLLKTTLLTVLVTSKGQILAGAVTPSLLYSDVAADAR
jgi:hypothetical protein